VLSVVQRWLSDQRMAGARLIVVTHDAIAVRAHDSVEGLHQSPVWGLVRSAQSENPGCFVLLDVDGQESSWDALPVALATAAALDEPQLALRAGELLAPRLTRVTVSAGGLTDGHVPADEATVGQAQADVVASENGNDTGGRGGEDATAAERVTPFDPSRTVLITGGTGELGRLLARHLVAKHAVKSLILASRRGAEAPGAQELRTELEGLGALVTLAACDVSDRKQLQALISSVPPDRPLGAVVHAAGVLDDGLIDALAPERLDRVLAAKADAAWHAHELTEHLDLQAFVLFSSSAAIFGGPGQGSYSAANAFLDSLAAYRRGLGLAGASIAWGLWAQTGGLTAGLSEVDLLRLRRSGIQALSADEGLELFDIAQSLDKALVIPMKVDTTALRSQARTGMVPPLLRGLVRIPARRTVERASLARRLMAVPVTEREAAVLEAVRSQIATVLGHDSSETIDPDRPLLELGFDSLTALELRHRLNDATALHLPATLVFSHPTAAALATYLHAELTAANKLLERETGETDPRRRSDSTPVENTLASLFRQAVERRMLPDGIALLMNAAKLYPTFSEPLREDELARPVRLATGDAPLELVCFSSFLATGGPHQYARFAKAFDGIANVTALPNPGFAVGEALPEDLQAVLETQAQAVQRSVQCPSFVLLGHSTGGVMAHAVARHLECKGISPAAVVLIDTHASTAFHAQFPQLFEAMFARDDLMVPIDDARLIAMASYGRLLAEFQPSEIEAPVLLVRAQEPMPGLPHDHDEWRVTWSYPHAAIDVAGDHFTMLEEHAHATATAVLKWCTELLDRVS
jgi:thioesterase domain-containing protein/NADP-dependent 3-hydroxy acid dehydrogenase YdfG/acyl carrier protein